MFIDIWFGYTIVVQGAEHNTAVGYIKPAGRNFQENEKAWLRDNLNVSYDDSLVLGIDSGKLTDITENQDYHKDSVFYILQSAANELHNIFHVPYKGE